VSSQIVSLDQLPAATSAERRMRHMVPWAMMAFFSFRCTMPMSKKPAIRPEWQVLALRWPDASWRPSRWSWRGLDHADLGIGEQRHAGLSASSASTT